MNEPTKQRYELWDQFLEHFPLEKLESMTLEEYSQVGSKDSFTWWIASGLDKLGSIWGGSPIKFGVFARKKDWKETRTPHHRNDEQYTWRAVFGETAIEAFTGVKSQVVQVAKAARNGDIDSIENVDLNDPYKWKIAYLYQDRENPCVLNIFKKEVLSHFLQAKTSTLPAKPDFALLYRKVLEHREGRDLLEFGDLIWKEGTIFQAYNKLKMDFFRYFSNFKSFTNPSETYLAEERNYKQELCSIYEKEIAPRLNPLSSDEGALIQLGKDISALFRRNLASVNNSPQNLVGWRYSEFTKELNDRGQIDFAKAVSRLTDPDFNLEKRIPDFVNFLHAHSVDGKCGPAPTRSLITFFLFLSDPKKHFFIKTSEVNKLLKLFNLDKFNNDSLAPEEYRRVQRLAGEIYSLLAEDGLDPQDMIDVQSFVWSALHAPANGDKPEKNPEKTIPTIHQPENVMALYPLNQILYGPPGTGKTYITAERAVRICDGSIPKDRATLMERYKELIEENRISFVSFHQSFSYEEFIEGIRPELTGMAESEQEQLIYKVEDGLLKKICSMAHTAVEDLDRPKALVADLKGRKFYKMSVGGKYDPEVESFCFENDYLALGWGGDVDFSKLPKEKKWEPARDAIKQLMVEYDSEQADKKFAIQAMFWFKNYVDVGDIVIVPKGLNQVQAIGQVTGEYEYKPDLMPGEGYEHLRKVKWLIKDAAIPVEKVWAKQFSQQSIYRLRPAHLNMDYLEKLLGDSEDNAQSTEAERYVLIIDEINRANISKVLGELITLIEPDKRLGQINEVTVKLPYSREEFGIPANLHIIGTMNTADRSLALMDTALRRRFEFEEMMPDYDLLADIEIEEIKIAELLRTMNQRIEALYDREHTIGHAFFMPLIQDLSIENLAAIFAHKIIPLLAEYFFEDWQKIRLVLGDNQKTNKVEAQFILEEELEDNGSVLFGNSSDLAMYGLDRVRQYVRNEEALNDPDAYIGIYNSAALKED